MPSLLVPKRRLDPEWMDRTDNTPADLEGALRDINRVNRFLGGSKVIVEAVRPYLERQGEGEILTVLDVGTGSADLPRDLVREARALRKRIKVTAIEKDPVTLAYAKAQTKDIPEIEIKQGDALHLDFPDGSYCLVTASSFLHHFGPVETVQLLASFRRIARREVFINDLRRHVIPWAFIGVAARATMRHPMFVHDAPLSVLRGFTASELRSAAQEAGALRPRLTRRWPFRLLLTLPARNAEP